jgi:hypothetical protein
MASYAIKYSEIFFVIRKFFIYIPPTIDSSYGPGHAARSMNLRMRQLMSTTHANLYL